MSAENTKTGVDRQLLTESIVIMIFSAIVFGITFTFDHVPEIFSQGIQPTVFPRAVLIIMFVLAALQAFKSVRLTSADAGKLKPFEPVPMIVLTTGILLVLLVVAMRTIGTFPSLALFCPAVALLWGERRWSVMLLGFGIFITFVYMLFGLLMNVPLP